MGGLGLERLGIDLHEGELIAVAGRRLRGVRDARALITLRARPSAAAQLTAGDFSWDRGPQDWNVALAELCAVIATDWRDLELAS